MPARRLLAFASLGGRRGILSEVNMVPLIDILLVLLAIFVIIPHRQMGLQADLPQTADPKSEPVPEVIIVQLSSDGSLRINQLVVEREELPLRLERIFALRAQRVALLQGARSSFTRWHRFAISYTRPALARSGC